MYYTDEMIEILGRSGYSVQFYNDDGLKECDIFFFGTYIDTVIGEYGLYNWMNDREMLY